MLQDEMLDQRVDQQACHTTKETDSRGHVFNKYACVLYNVCAITIRKLYIVYLWI